jgi:pyrimidine deaminase RibD-like protein
MSAEDEVQVLDEIWDLCIGNSRDHNEIVMLFQSNSQPQIVFVETAEAIIYALEMCCEDGSTRPCFRVVAKSPKFAIEIPRCNEPVMEVPGSGTVISALFEEERLRYSIILFELKENALERVVGDSKATRLVELARNSPVRNSQYFSFSPDGKSLFLAEWNPYEQRSQGTYHFYSLESGRMYHDLWGGEGGGEGVIQELGAVRSACVTLAF